MACLVKTWRVKMEIEFVHTNFLKSGRKMICELLNHIEHGHLDDSFKILHAKCFVDFY